MAHVSERHGGHRNVLRLLAAALPSFVVNKVRKMGRGGAPAASIIIWPCLWLYRKQTRTCAFLCSISAGMTWGTRVSMLDCCGYQCLWCAKTYCCVLCPLYLLRKSNHRLLAPSCVTFVFGFAPSVFGVPWCTSGMCTGGYIYFHAVLRYDKRVFFFCFFFARTFTLYRPSPCGAGRCPLLWVSLAPRIT